MSYMTRRISKGDYPPSVYKLIEHASLASIASEMGIPEQTLAPYLKGRRPMPLHVALEFLDFVGEAKSRKLETLQDMAENYLKNKDE